MRVIRGAVAEDLAAIVAIVAESATAPQWSESDFAVTLTSPAEAPLRRVVLVCEEDGAVSGFAVYTLLVPVFPPEAELESLAVAPAFRRRGVGGALLKAVAGAALEAGAESLALEVRAGNEGAMALYREAGFETARLRKGYYSVPKEDAVLMLLPLGVPSPQSDEGATGGSLAGQ